MKLLSKNGQASHSVKYQMFHRLATAVAFFVVLAITPCSTSAQTDSVKLPRSFTDFAKTRFKQIFIAGFDLWIAEHSFI